MKKIKNFVLILLSISIFVCTIISIPFIASAESSTRVYLGKTTCENIPYQYQEWCEEGEKPNILTGYNPRLFYFVAEEEGFYQLTLPYQDLSIIKIIADNYDTTIEPFKKMHYYFYLKKNERMSFSYTDNEDFHPGVKSYTAEISQITDNQTITDGTISKYSYTVIPQSKSIILKKSKTVSDSHTMPSSLLSLPITEINEYAFYNLGELTEIIIPDTVNTIADYAFTNCFKLKKVVILNKDCVYGKNSFFGGREDLIIQGGYLGNSKIDYNTPEKTSISNATISGIQNKTYTGKSIVQNIKVKVGKTFLKQGNDYTVSYKNNKKIGKATIIVSGCGNYEGQIKKAFNIVPMGTSLSKVNTKKKGFTVKWIKQTNNTTGYQIQYSRSKSFKSGNKTVTIKKKSTTAKTVKNLKAKKKYFVRIRTYKTVGDKKYYSGWSPVKTVTTKK